MVPSRESFKCSGSGTTRGWSKLQQPPNLIERFAEAGQRELCWPILKNREGAAHSEADRA